jgi:hypothetical protein
LVKPHATPAYATAFAASEPFCGVKSDAGVIFGTTAES